MILGCPSCGAQLRMKDDSHLARASAKCPKCGGTVPLKPSEAGSEPSTAAARILVACGSCGARLKAPASSAGARSHCPKCRAEVVIRAAAGAAPAARSPQTQDDASGAATRRMDSRSLGLSANSPPSVAPGGIDLDAFIKTGAPAGPAEASDGPGMAAALMKPPVAEMEKIAVGIRDAARGFQPSEPASGAAPPAASPKPADRRTPHPQASRLEDRESSKETTKEPPRAFHHGPSELAAAARPFPATRGLVLGALAGAIVGAASLCAVVFGGAVLQAFIAPLPLVVTVPGLPDNALRVMLPVLLGALSGFLASSAGSPSRADHPLRVVRSAGFALLAGLACGLVATLSADEGLAVWPIASWMRDLLLVGLLTTALNNMVPAPRS